MLNALTISKEHEHLYFVTDSISEAAEYIKQKSIVAFGLQYAKHPKPFWGFFEKGFKKIGLDALIPSKET